MKVFQFSHFFRIQLAEIFVYIKYLINILFLILFLFSIYLENWANFSIVNILSIKKKQKIYVCVFNYIF